MTRISDGELSEIEARAGKAIADRTAMGPTLWALVKRIPALVAEVRRLQGANRLLRSNIKTQRHQEDG